jgi:hypothetical protein
MDTQDSEEDFFFRGSRRYPSRGAGGFSSAGQGAERPSGDFSGADRDTKQPPRPPPQRQSRPEPPQQERQEPRWDPPEQSQNQDRGQREEQSRRSQESQNQRGAEPPPGRDQRRSSGAGGGGGGFDRDSDDDLGYRPPNRSGSGGGSGGGSGNRGRRGAPPEQNAAAGGAGGAPPPPPPAGGGGGAGAGGPPLDGFSRFAQGLTNAMNAIANQVIRASGKSVKNGGWPYFDGTFKEYPSFKRKFRTYQANYHQATPQRELAQDIGCDLRQPAGVHQGPDAGDQGDVRVQRGRVREDDGVLHAAPVAHSRGRQSGCWRHVADPGQHSGHDSHPALRRRKAVERPAGAHPSTRHRQRVLDLRRPKVGVRHHAGRQLRAAGAPEAYPPGSPRQQVTINGPPWESGRSRRLSEPGKLSEPRRARDGHKRGEEASRRKEGALPASQEIRPRWTMEVPMRGRRWLPGEAFSHTVRGLQEDDAPAAAASATWRSTSAGPRGRPPTARSKDAEGSTTTCSTTRL